MCWTAGSALGKWSGSFSFCGIEGLPGSQNLFRMCLAFRFEEDLPDDPFFVDQERSAMQAKVLSAVQLFFTPDPVFADDDMVRVGDERKGQAKLFPEFAMLFLVVGADTHNEKTGGAQQAIVVAQVAGLHRAGGCVVLRI